MKIKDIFKRQSTQGSESTEDFPRNNYADLADEIVQEMLELHEEGIMERPIEEYIADENFCELLKEYPVKAAIRIYDAESKARESEKAGRQSAIDEIYKRKSMPKSMRAAQPAAAETDFSKMSSEEFARIKKRLAQGN